MRVEFSTVKKDVTLIKVGFNQTAEIQKIYINFNLLNIIHDFTDTLCSKIHNMYNIYTPIVTCQQLHYYFYNETNTASHSTKDTLKKIENCRI